MRRIPSTVSGVRLFVLLAVSLSLLLTLPAGAQSFSYPAVYSRVTQTIDESQLVTLTGHVHPQARPEFDQGAVEDNLPVEHLILELKRSPEQDAAVALLVDQLHNRNSALFHQWLAPEDFGRHFGPTDSDISKVTNWLRSKGFTIEDVPPGRTHIVVSGTAGQVRTALHTQLHNLNVNGEKHIAVLTEPQVPAALALVIAGFRQLHDWHASPLYHPAGAFQRDSQSGAWRKIAASTSTPELTMSSGPYYVVGPQDWYTIYNSRPLYQAGITGAGTTIAVLEETEVANPADVTTFRSQFALPAYPAIPNSTQGGVNWVYGPGNGCSAPPRPTSTGEETEALIDVEWAGAIAPNAIVDFVACNSTGSGIGSYGTDLAASYVANYLSSTVVATSLSYGECEISAESTGALYYQSVWQQLAAEGITAVVSAGDAGSLGCEFTNSELSTNAMSSTPYNVSAGGTDFSDYYQTLGYTDWWSLNNGTGYSSALSYIPEVTWDAVCSNPLLVSFWQYTGNTTYGNTYTSLGFCNSWDGSANTGPEGGGGGVSLYHALPAWQGGVYGVGNAATSTSFRNEPDLSFFASAGSWGHFLPYCQSDTGHVCNYSTTALGAGGTSFVAPQIAGLMALVNQHAGSRQGLANYTLYSLAANEYGTPDSPNITNLYACSGSGKGAAVGGSCIFRDIANDTPSLQGGTVTSDIVQPCFAPDVTNCYSPDGEEIGLTSIGDRSSILAYQTAPGYDDATGLGSANAYNLVMGWNNGGSFSSTASLSANPLIVTPAAASTTLTATVVATGRGGKVAPVGTVSFFIGSTSGKLLGTANLSSACSGSAGSTSCSGTATLTVPASRLNVGSNSIIASFGGDGANDAPSISAPVNVLYEVGPDLTISNSNSGSFTQGQTGAVYTITVSNNGGSPTSGVVTVTDALPSGLTATAISGTGWSCTLSTLTCTRADALAAGHSYPAITLTVNVAGNAPGSVTNTATVSGGGDVNPGNNSAGDLTTILLSGPDLTISKSHSGNFTQEQTGAVYTITVSNVGGTASSGTVTVTDALPTGLLATSINGTGWTCTLSTLTCTRADSLGALSSYPAITLTVNVLGNAPASLTNTATVSGGGDVNLNNNTASSATTVVQIAGNIITVAGNGFAGYSGDGGLATSAEMQYPYGSAKDAQGNLYIADEYYGHIRKVNAVTGDITTVAGGGSGCAGETDSVGDGCPATSAMFNAPTGVALDGAANIYIADFYSGLVRKVSATTGVITAVAGGGTGCAGQTDPAGDGCPATSGQIMGPIGVAVNLAGDIYIADIYNNRIRKVTAATGVITTVAGNGYTDEDSYNGAFAGDGGPATSANLNNPQGVALDSAGNLYIADTQNNVVREVYAATGVINTVAGASPLTTNPGYSGDGGLATNAQFSYPTGVAVDLSYNLYIADNGNHCIRQVNGNGVIDTLAGNGTAGYSGDGGPAAGSELYFPEGVTADTAGNVYIADTANERLREVGASLGARAVTSVTLTSSANPALPASTVTFTAKLTYPGTLPVGVVTFYDGTVALGAAWLNSSQVATFATSSLALGTQSITASYSGDPNNLPSTSAALSQTISGSAPVPVLTSLSPSTLAAGANAFLLTVNGSNFAGTSTVLWNGGSRTTTFLSSTQLRAAITAADVAALGTATVTVSTPAPGGGVSNGLTFVIQFAAVITTAAGDGTPGYSGDNGAAISAELNHPEGTAVDASGNLYIADMSNNRIRKVSGGEITTVAGTGTAGSSGDNGPAASAELNQPVEVAVDGSGNIYIADTSNNRIRKVSGGEITTVAGGGSGCAGQTDSVGDGCPATSAELNEPEGLVVDANGNLYIAEVNNNRVRKVTVGTGVITTVAGNGTAGYSGDKGQATSAELNEPAALALDAADQNLYIADWGNQAVRKVNFGTGVITTVAGAPDPCGYDVYGNERPCFDGDGGPATSALLTPAGLVLDAAGNLYISDVFNYVVREVNASTGIITTVVGGGSACVLGGCLATSAWLGIPAGLAMDAGGDLYIADSYLSTIWLIPGLGGVNASVPVLTETCPTVTYDGNAHSCTATAKTTGGATVSGSWSFNPVSETAVGNYEITAVFLSGNSSYRSGGLRQTLTISAQPVTATVTAASKVYDGTNAAAITSCTLSGVLPADQGNVTCSVAAATFASIAPGTNIAVTATGIALSGPAAAHYALTSNMATTTASISVNLSGLVIPYMTSQQVAVAGSPEDVAVDNNGNLYVATGGQVMRIDAVTGASTVFAGGGVKGASCPTPDTTVNGGGNRFGDGCPATYLFLGNVRGLAINTTYLYIADEKQSQIHRVALGSNALPGQRYANEAELVAGGTAVIGHNPRALAVDVFGNVFWGGPGVGMANYNTNPPTVKSLGGGGVVNGLTFDQNGNLYFVSKPVFGVLKMTPNPSTGVVDGTGTLSTLVGDNQKGTYGGPWYNTLGTPAFMGTLRSVTSASRDPNTRLSNTTNLYVSTSNGVWFYNAQTGWAHQILKSATALGCTANSSSPYLGCPAPQATFAGAEGGARMSVDQHGNLYIADFGNKQIVKVGIGADFTGTAPGISTNPSVPLTQTVLIHGTDACTGTMTAASSPFAVGSATCTSYTVGDDGTDWLVPVTYTPTADGYQTGTLTVGTSGIPLDGYGNNIQPVTVTCSNETKTYGAFDPALAYTANYTIGVWRTPPVCGVGIESGVSGSPYPISVTDCSHIAALGFGPFTCNPGELTVVPAPVTAAVTAANKWYDGTTTATITSCTLSGVLPADLSNVTCRAVAANFASPNAGTDITVTASGITLSGSAAANYVLTSTTATTTANISSANTNPIGVAIPYWASQQLSIFEPGDAVIDQNGNMYVATAGEVMEINAVTGASTVFAGGGTKGASCPSPDTNVNGGGNRFGDGCPATYGFMGNIRGLAINTTYLYIGDENQSVIHRVGLSSSPLAGQRYAHELEMVAIEAGNPYGIAVDAYGNVFWGHGPDYAPAVLMANVSTKPPTVHTVVNISANGNNPNYSCPSGAGLTVTPATNALVGGIVPGLAFDSAGNLYFAEKPCASLAKVTPNPSTGIVDGTGTFSVLLGNGATGTYGGPWYNTLRTPAYMGHLHSVTTASRDPNTLLSNTRDLYVLTTNGMWFYDAQTGWAHQILKSATTLNCSTYMTPPYMGCPAPVMSFAAEEGGGRASVDKYGNLYIADYGNNQIMKVAAGPDFIGTAPAVATAAPLTHPILIHSTNPCSGTTPATASPFALGSETCTSYSVGDNETDWVIPVTYSPSANGYQSGTLAVGSLALPLDGTGKNVEAVTVTCGSKAKAYGSPDPAFTYTTNYTVGTWSTAPVCGVATENGVAGSPYPITVLNCSTLAAAGFGPFTCNSGELTVSPLPVTASVTAANKWYDTTTTASITSCTLSGVLPADLNNVTCVATAAAFASANVGTGITVTATGITLQGPAAADYSLASSTATTTASIAAIGTIPTTLAIPYMTSQQLAAAGPPEDVVVDNQGNMYVAIGQFAGLVFKIDAVTGAATVFAGGGTRGASCVLSDLTVNGGGNKFGDGCPATELFLGDVRGLAIDGMYLYISDENATQIHRVGLWNDPLPGQLYINEAELVAGGTQVIGHNPRGVAVDAHGNVFWGGPGVSMADYSTNPPTYRYLGLGGKVNGLTFDRNGNLYAVQKWAYSVFKMAPNPSTGVIDGTGTWTMLVGNGSYDGIYGGPWYSTVAGPAFLGTLRSVTTAGRDPNTLLANTNDLYISTTNGIWFVDAQTGWAHMIMKTDGDGNLGCPADSTPPYLGCPAPAANFSGAEGGARMSVDQYGNLYLADFGDNQIVKLAVGTDFIGTAPASVTSASAPVTQTALIHGSGTCPGTALAATSPFDLGTTNCSSYSVGDDGSDWLVPITYTPTANGNQAGSLAVGSAAIPLDGSGSGAGSGNQQTSVTASVTALSMVYNGATTEPVVNVTCTLTPSESNLGCAAGAAAFASANVGTGITVTATGITLSGTAASNYALSSTTATTTANITAASVTPAVTALSMIYNGTTTEPVANVTCTLTPSESNLGCAAGAATFASANEGTGITVTVAGITLSGSAASNYVLSTTSATTTANITAASVTPAVTALSMVYNGSTTEPVANVTCTLTPSESNLSCAPTAAAFASANVGTGITVTATGITLSGSAASNYALSSTTATTTANITAASVTASVTALSMVYNGTTTEPVGNVTCTLTPSESNLGCAAGAATFASANVGTGITVTVTGITLSGSAASNYALSSTTATTTANITAASVTASVTALSMVYNGTTTEPVGNVTCTLTPSESNLSCAPAAAAFATANVGTGITVTVTGITLSGTAAGNYALSSTTATTTASITAASVTPSVTALSMVYNGTTTEPVANVTCTLTPSESNLGCAAGAATFASANEGTGITVTVAGITLSGSAASNYVLSTTSATTTANITAATVTPGVTALSMVYNGTTTEPVANVTCTLTPSVSNLTCAAGAAAFASANVGTGITVTVTGITLSGSAASNYALSSTSATTTANITAATVTPSVTALSMVYNGTTTEPVANVTCTLTPGVSNLSCAAGAAAFASANVGTGITVTVTGITLSGSAASNYALSTTTATTTANITAASVTPSVTALSKVYNGTTTEPVGNVTCTLTPSVSNLSCAAGAATFASANVGTGITVTVTGITLSGSAASNYALSTTTATTTANITAASVAPSVTALSMVYNGTTTEPVANVTCTLTPSESNLGCAAGAATFASANVGTGITVTVTGITLTGSAASNYALSATTATTTASITKATPTITVSCPTVTYDGKAHSCTATAKGVGGVTVSGSFSFNPASETAVGVYTVTATFTSTNSNYSNGSGTGTLTIKAKS